MKDLVTTIAGFTGMAGFVVDSAISSGVVSPNLAPVVKAAQALAIAVIGWYIGKPSQKNA